MTVLAGLDVTPEWITPALEDEIATRLAELRGNWSRSSRRPASDVYRIAAPLDDAPLSAISKRLYPVPTLATALWYEPGQAMAPHIDATASGPIIWTLGLCADAVMVFSRDGQPSVRVMVPRRALVTMKDTVRWLYRHEVLPVSQPRISIVFQTPDVEI